VYNLFNYIFVTKLEHEKQQILSSLFAPIYAFAAEIINHHRPLLDAIELTYPQY
jgi:hypothetical protein